MTINYADPFSLRFFADHCIPSSVDNYYLTAPLQPSTIVDAPNELNEINGITEQTIIDVLNDPNVLNQINETNEINQKPLDTTEIMIEYLV